MTQRMGVLTHPGEVAQADGFGEVLTQMLLVAIVMFAIAATLTLLTLGAT